LTPREAASLAAALPNPHRYRPDGRSRYATNRAEKIYSIMVRRGIVIEDYEEVMQEGTGKDMPSDIVSGQSVEPGGLPQAQRDDLPAGGTSGDDPLTSAPK
jgi:monofunctional biosynthetic peptidoglycan transglycosylase